MDRTRAFDPLDRILHKSLSVVAFYR
jgi:hypothetical protein